MELLVPVSDLQQCSDKPVYFLNKSRDACLRHRQIERQEVVGVEFYQRPGTEVIEGVQSSTAWHVESVAQEAV